MPWTKLSLMFKIMLLFPSLGAAMLCLSLVFLRFAVAEGVAVNAWFAPVVPNKVDATQAIGGPYQFTDDPYLPEVASEI